MIEVAIMIEGQNGLTWERWQKLAILVEELGFVGLYRSDHYTNAQPPDKESLELWVSLTWLASHTKLLEFGQLVSPLSFRDPTMLARMASAVDDLSGGRMTLGLGAGWQEREHSMFGWDLLDIPQRMARFEEGIQIVKTLIENDEPSTFEGEYYQIREAVVLPRPARAGGPPLLVGGNGEKVTMPIAAKYASEWNGIYLQPEEFARKSSHLDELLKTEGREPNSMKRSMMGGLEFGRDEAEVNDLVEKRTQGKLDKARLRGRSVLVGTTAEIVDHLGELEQAGCQRIMLQWLALDDLDRLEAFGSSVLPQLN